MARTTPPGRSGRPPRARTGPSPLTGADVASLRAAAQRFGAPARSAKAALIAALASRSLHRPRILLACHDALLFVAAHPDDEAIAAAAEAALARCARAARALAATPSGRRALEGTGIAWSEVSAALGYDIARWLVHRFPGHAEITSLGDGAGTLPSLLALLLPAIEADALAGERAGGLALLDRCKGPRDTRLAFLVRQLESLAAPAAVRAQLFDALTPFLTVAPRGTRASRTFLRGPAGRVHRHAAPLRKAPAEALAVVAQPPPRERPLARAERRALVDVARATLAVLARETDPITWASVDGVSLHDLEAGFAVALFPMEPARRFALDSHTGYLLFRQRVPIAYGGGWPFLGVCRIGVNVFPAFRGGESALAFAHVLRVYRARFGVARFVVEPYQFGAGNAEALRSGAFWFYWRLGFRPLDEGIAALAEREHARLQRVRGARTPLPRMRALAREDLALDLAPTDGPLRVEPARLSTAVARWIVDAHGGDRRKAQAAALARVGAALGAAPGPGWTTGERAAYRSLALLVGLVDDLDRWSAADKAACVALMRAKGAPDDAPFFAALARHPRLPAALARIADAAATGG